MADRPKRNRRSPHFDDSLTGHEGAKREKHKAREMRKTQWWKRQLARGVCYYCGRMFPPAELTMDHVVPLSRGGKTTKGNVVPACKTCNTEKHRLVPVEWEAYLDRLDKEEI